MRILLGIALAMMCCINAMAQVPTETFSTNDGSSDRFNSNSGTGNPQGVGGDCKTGPLYSCPTGRQTNNPPRLPGERNDRFDAMSGGAGGGDLIETPPIPPWWLNATDPLRSPKWEALIGGTMQTETIDNPDGTQVTIHPDSSKTTKYIGNVKHNARHSDAQCAWWWHLHETITYYFKDHWSKNHTTQEIGQHYSAIQARFVVTTQADQDPKIVFNGEQFRITEPVTKNPKTKRPQAYIMTLGVATGTFQEAVRYAFSKINAAPYDAKFEDSTPSDIPLPKYKGIPSLPEEMIMNFPKDPPYVHGVYISAHFNNSSTVGVRKVLSTCLDWVKNNVKIDGRLQPALWEAASGQTGTIDATDLVPR
jgi:hypothetical protein